MKILTTNNKFALWNNKALQFVASEPPTPPVDPYNPLGLLALYQQASTQTNPPSDHEDCFIACGVETQTGLAELEQIPSDWGGWGE